MNRKASLGIVMMIIIILASSMVVYTITARFVGMADKGLQDSICRSNIVGAYSVKNSNTVGETGWVRVAKELTPSRTAGEALLEHPLCSTQIEYYDYTDITHAEAEREFATDLGEMIQSCWSTFSEGKLANTFGQTEEGHTYYFPCYKFKFDLKGYKGYFETAKYDSVDGYLSQYNLKGTCIKEDCKFEANDFETFPQIYRDQEDDQFLSYAGYVVWSGFGFLFFSDGIGVKSGTAIDWWGDGRDRQYSSKYTGWLIGQTRYQTMNFEDTSVLEKLNSGDYYEIRYYSPFFDLGDRDSSFFVNGIAIVPININDGETHQIDPINYNVGGGFGE